VTGVNPVVLVVDDDDELRDVLREVLCDAGYDVAVAGDGLEALDVLERKPDVRVMLLDLMMPRMDGVQLLKVLAEERGSIKRPRVIALSAGGPNLLSAARRAGAQTAFQKPISIEALLDAVEDACAPQRHSS
jgi:CheY-like chemotaxis protein